jgi:hypothetical protein
MPRIVAGIVSGGQSGVDRAALDVALDLGLPCRGWCPAGRRAEDGAIPSRYPLRETPSADPAERTEWNVRDSHATLILSPHPLTGGTALTAELAVHYGRPLLIAGPRGDSAPAVRGWIAGLDPGVWLNVAGPRESELPGVYDSVRTLLPKVLRRFGRTAASDPRAPHH